MVSFIMVHSFTKASICVCLFSYTNFMEPPLLKWTKELNAN